MASIRQLKSRIRSVKSTKQITKAMEMVAASKMRRAQEATKASADYARLANEILTHLGGQEVTNDHRLYMQRTVQNRLVIVIASDKGLAGAYTTNVLKCYLQEMTASRQESVGVSTIAIGRKVAQFATRLARNDVLGVYEDLDDSPSGREVRSILDSAVTEFTEGRVDAVDIIYTKFHSAIDQRPTVMRVLPAGYTYTEVSETIKTAEFEPDASTVLEEVTYRLVESQLYQALLDARASEHSMRMVAMKNATDNATDLADDLTLEMNKARQAAITQELAEISGGVEAMKE
jgi:F-type H+-transporting ATPase subunit gamma